MSLRNATQIQENSYVYKEIHREIGFVDDQYAVRKILLRKDRPVM